MGKRPLKYFRQIMQGLKNLTLTEYIDDKLDSGMQPAIYLTSLCELMMQPAVEVMLKRQTLVIASRDRKL